MNHATINKPAKITETILIRAHAVGTIDNTDDRLRIIRLDHEGHHAGYMTKKVAIHVVTVYQQLIYCASHRCSSCCAVHTHMQCSLRLAPRCCNVCLVMKPKTWEQFIEILSNISSLTTGTREINNVFTMRGC